MARVQWHGSSFIAEPKEQLENGDWLMVAKEHGPRCSPGTIIRVKQNEIVEMAAAEMPDTATSQAALDKALAEERKTITPVAELLAVAARERAEAPS